MNESPANSPRILIMAFQGWSDAGDATTQVLQHLTELLDIELLEEISAEEFVDFQVHRPKLVREEDGSRSLDWPDTRFFGPLPKELNVPVPENASESDAPPTIRTVDGEEVRNLYVLAGVEPARHWQAFADEIEELLQRWHIDLVVTLGSMYSDSPHSRPIVTALVSDDAEARDAFGAEKAEYEGPIGIASVIDFVVAANDITAVSIWAQVPHYVHSTPSPKATLALLDKLEELLDIVIPRGALVEMANDWETNINRIADADEEMSQYIKRLEESRDEELAAEATGDALAIEFEKFLEDRGEQSAEDSDEADTQE